MEKATITLTKKQLLKELMWWRDYGSYVSKYHNKSNKKQMEKIIFELIDSLVSSGKIFSANFTKADGTERTMSCRVGVQKDLKGKGLQYDRRKARNLIVWDMNANGYRTIKTDRLNWIQIEGEKYNFDKV